MNLFIDKVLPCKVLDLPLLLSHPLHLTATVSFSLHRSKQSLSASCNRNLSLPV
uniref:Uncharacterized protein n=1 Tax=Anguilla anguilla TaxID=7936 RepID=A0A0E9WSP2_ANGAN